MTRALALALGLAARAFAADAPVAVKAPDVPLFAGAVRDASSEEEAREQGGPGADVKAYQAPASPDEVLKFYVAKLAAKDASGQGMLEDPAALAPGKASQPEYDATFYELDDEPGVKAGTVELAGTAKRASLAKLRKPFSPEKWLESATVMWHKKDAAGLITTWQIDIEDGGFDYEVERAVAFKKLANKTRIVVTVQVQSTAQDAEGD